MHCIIAARCIRSRIIVVERLPKIIEDGPFELSEVQPALAVA
jgi:hypothetical protein